MHMLPACKIPTSSYHAQCSFGQAVERLSVVSRDASGCMGSAISSSAATEAGHGEYWLVLRFISTRVLRL